MKLYSRQHLLQRLKREGLPGTDNTLEKYRQEGIIPEGDFTVEFPTHISHLYSKDLLDRIVEKIRNYKEKKRGVCKVLKCPREHYARGFCRNHYMSRYHLKKSSESIR